MDELLQFLRIDARSDLKTIALNHVLSLTGSAEGRTEIYAYPQIIHNLICLSMDFEPSIAKESVLCLVNISADEPGAKLLLVNDINIILTSVRFIKDAECAHADAWTMVLSNLSRPEHLIENVLDHLLAKDETLSELVSIFTKVEYNQKKCHLNYLAPIFSNISQSSRGRARLCDTESDLLMRLLPFLSHENNIRRGGIIGLLKNICFDSTRHDWLLHELNILPFLLLPLAGPEEFSDEDNDMFPVELQYLDESKTRDPDPDLRKMLLESLTQLCATRKARDYLRSKGTYEILRELHKFECGDEGERTVLIACENVVDILIRTEDEIGEDNLKELSIPDEYVEKFDKDE